MPRTCQAVCHLVVQADSDVSACPDSKFDENYLQTRCLACHSCSQRTKRNYIFK